MLSWLLNLGFAGGGTAGPAPVSTVSPLYFRASLNNDSIAGSTIIVNAAFGSTKIDDSMHASSLITNSVFNGALITDAVYMPTIITDDVGMHTIIVGYIHASVRIP